MFYPLWKTEIYTVVKSNSVSVMCKTKIQFVFWFHRTAQQLRVSDISTTHLYHIQLCMTFRLPRSPRCRRSHNISNRCWRRRRWCRNSTSQIHITQLEWKKIKFFIRCSCIIRCSFIIRCGCIIKCGCIIRCSCINRCRCIIRYNCIITCSWITSWSYCSGWCFIWSYCFSWCCCFI